MPRDQTLPLLRTGYPWGPRLREGKVAVPTRVFGRKAVLVGGPEGVRRFYDPRLRRRGAFSPPIKLVLFGPGAVHGLDDEDHHARKALFVDTLTPDLVGKLVERSAGQWGQWATAGPKRPGVFFLEAAETIGAAVLPWAGIEVEAAEQRRWARQMLEVVDGFITLFRPYARAVRARWELDRWARGLVRQVRSGQRETAPGTALDAVATFRTKNGGLLPARVAAVELLNIVRPSVAVAWFVTFAAVALDSHAEWRERLLSGDQETLRAFCQEVRRLYPFVPVLAARARRRQDVLGYQVRRGGYVLLDVYGTTHDPGSWPEPESFDPDRFLGRPIDPDALVPQGGGDVRLGHRCPGEEVVLTLLATAVRRLVQHPPRLLTGDAHWDLARMPAPPGLARHQAAKNHAAEQR